MRDSYTVTLPEEPPALPDLHKDLRPRTSMPGSLLVSTFVGLVLNKTKVRAPRLPAAPALWLGGRGGGAGRGQPLPSPGSRGYPMASPLPEDGGPGGGCPSWLATGPGCPGIPQEGQGAGEGTCQGAWVPLPALPLR